MDPKQRKLTSLFTISKPAAAAAIEKAPPDTTFAHTPVVSSALMFAFIVCPSCVGLYCRANLCSQILTRWELGAWAPGYQTANFSLIIGYSNPHRFALCELRLMWGLYTSQCDPLCDIIVFPYIYD